MEFRELGRSGIKVSVIGIGAWQWGSTEWGWGQQYGKKDLLGAFEKALELGINFIDTAEIYGRGRSEQLVGEAIRGHREEVVIATKVSPWNLTYGRLLKAAERSLRRLGVDVIDLYQVHSPNPLVPIRSTMKAMKKLVKEGRVRCVGVSNFNLRRMNEAEETLAPINLASNQVKYNLLDRGIEIEILPHAASGRISIIAYSPLAQGLLTGKYSPYVRPKSIVQEANSRFSSRNLARLMQFNNLLFQIAAARNRTPSQVALNWVISKECVIGIPGVKNPANVLDDSGAVGWRLTESESKQLEQAAAALRFDRLRAIPGMVKAFVRPS